MDRDQSKPPKIDKNETLTTAHNVETVFGVHQPKDPNNINVTTMETMGTVDENVNTVADAVDVQRRIKKPVTYAAKKTIAQGMMDIALITSNANQLKNLFEYQSKSAAFWYILVLISTSLVLQIVVGVSLIFKGRFDTKGKDRHAAARVNKWMLSGVFLITILNIFTAVFSTGPLAQSRETSQGTQTTN